MRVLHVTEASGAGVLASLVALAQGQVSEGLEVSVIMALRDDSPSPPELIKLLGPEVQLHIIASRGMTLRTATRMFFAILHDQRELGRPDFTHYHSTFAGIVGRLTSRLTARSPGSFYSPHGFAFLREDASPLIRLVLELLERSLHRLGSTMIVVSKSEEKVARKHVSRKRIEVLENKVDLSRLPVRTNTIQPPTLVGTAARVVHQKAPWKFAELAKELAPLANFVWIGGGAQEDVRTWLGGSSVKVTGWLAPEASLEQMANLDIYVSTALWEGLPMSVIQAQAMGIPCVLSAVDGHVDIVVDGVTGYVCETEAEMLVRLEHLLRNPAHLRSMGEAARLAASRFDYRTLGAESLDIYSRKRK